ncbi:hypothetical protein [Nocardia sp. CA-290969]|uniref:hypothetical protein n=1 Tax=Nocardia sp. CA-290969 TaxID=3239986 RepID=UPI003D932A6E
MAGPTGAGQAVVKISAGDPGWYEACSAAERAATAELAATRWKWSVCWAALAALGVVLTIGAMVSGALAALAAEPPIGALAVALCALLLDAGLLTVNSFAWQQVGLIFSGAAPSESVRPYRWLRWIPASLVSLFGTLAMLAVGVYPLSVYGDHGLGGLGLAGWLTAGAAVLCVMCGLATLWLKVILRPVRTGR